MKGDAGRNEVHPTLVAKWKPEARKGLLLMRLADEQYLLTRFFGLRRFDDIYIERLWRSVKYEEAYPHDYADLNEAERRLDGYFGFYNPERPHAGLQGSTPWAL